MIPLKIKPDPLSARERALNRELASVEAQIRKLSQRLEADRPDVCRPLPDLPAHVRRKLQRPVFEEIERSPVTGPAEATPNHFNDLGVRKYDLVATLRRLRGIVAGGVWYAVRYRRA